MDDNRLAAIVNAITKVIGSVTALVLAIMGVISIFAGNPAGVTTDTVEQTTTVAQPAAPPATAVDGADADRRRDDALPLDADAQELLEDVSTEAGKLGNEIDSPLREPDDGPVIEIQGPLATPTFPGCRTAFVRNYSSRYGTRPQVIVWHQTVSRENGISSQNALTALANSATSGVSWHFLIGRSNGLCTYTVPLDAKAWTQANANPFSIGIEVEAYGDESTYVTGAGKAKLMSVTRRLGQIYGIPMRRGIVRDCRVIKPGIVEHKDLDQDTTCAGGHADVNLPGTDALISELARSNRPPTGVDGRRCRALRYHRQKVRAGAKYRDRLVIRGRATTRRKRMTYLRTVLDRAGVDQRHLCNR